MVHEAAVVEYLGFDGAGGKRRRTIASNAVIPVGTLLVLSDPNTVAAHSTTRWGTFGGIAAEQKRGDGEDYATTIAVYTDGVFNLYASGNITVGQAVALSATPNFVTVITTAANVASAGIVVGYAEQTASTNEVIRVRVAI